MSTDFEIREGLSFGFIDNSVSALSRFQPALVTNRNGTVLDTLEEELRSATSFTIAVAFVTSGGLLDLKSTLADIAAKGIHGRLITSTYLSFNNPEVFDDLLHIPNLDVRVINKDGFHTKAYYFKHHDFESILIGSANLTQKALKQNFEWNLRVTSTDRGDIVHSIKDELDDLWNQATPLTRSWISDYKNTWERPIYPVKKKQPKELGKILPNEMQSDALQALKHLRDSEHAKRGLVVAATGTGKTYMAAFDVQQFRPKRLLFVAHREQILKKSMESFKEVLGGDDEDYGILSGSKQDIDARYLFATVNMVSKEDIRTKLGADRFDYIIIDEAHRVGQNQSNKKQSMYQELMNFYKPQFMLGMTATPERTDGTNVYEYFDYNLAYEISLLDSLDHELLAPFHYIGVTDYEKDGQVINDTTNLKYLVSDERVDYIIEKTKYYGPRGNNVHGLIFVSRVAEGQELEMKLNDRGIKAQFVSGADTVETREHAVRKLMNNELQYIITVDIFNEGVDIPNLNQIIMMRPTKSSIIFLQQLGRGLRKYHNKEYVTVLDFIGNYDENYMIPMAFDHSHTSNKEKIRKQIISPSISGVSTIHFEEVARKRVLDAVSKVRLNKMRRFRDGYNNLKDKIGSRPPMLLDFVKRGNISIPDIIDKFDNLYNMQKKFEDNFSISLNKEQYNFIDIVSKEVAISRRPLEAWALKQLMTKGTLTDSELLSDFKAHDIFCDQESLDNTAKVLDLSYFTAKNRKNYGNIGLIEHNDKIWKLSSELQAALSSPVFEQYFTDAIDVNLEKLNQDPKAYQKRFTIGEKYYRSDVIKLLNWDKEPIYLNIGGYSLRSDGKFVPVFVSLKKGEKFQNKVAYKNSFFDRSTMRWFSKSGRTTTSNTEQQIISHQGFGMIQLFVKKFDDDKLEGNDFYYLGSAKVLDAKDTVEENVDGKPTKLIDFTLRLENEVNLSLYRALTDDL